MRLIISLLLLSISFRSFSCMCVTPPFSVRYQESDFIAKAKIIKVSGNGNSVYLNAEIEVIELFKGNMTKSIKVHNVYRSSCGIDIPENTTWIIFAKKDDSENMTINSCSGCLEIKEVLYDEKYPNYKKNIEARIARTLDILTYLKKENLNYTNDYRLTPDFTTSCFSDLEGFPCAAQKYSVFELTIQKDLSISGVKPLIEFDNPDLANKLRDCIQKHGIINSIKVKQVPANTKILLICFFYPAEGEYKSVISLHIV